MAFYDPEENAVVIFHGVLEIFEDHYILRDPMMLTPEGPRPHIGVVVLGKINELTNKNTPTGSEKNVRPQTTAPATAPVSSGAESTFTATDVCDRCGARAYVRATVADGDNTHELLFCGHHGRKHLPSLNANPNITVTDETDRLYDEVSAEN